jgi:hypothetical protein
MEGAMTVIQLDPDEPRFSLKQLLQVVPGLDAELLKGWIRRRHICTNVEKPGRGSVRRYSFHEVVQIGAMHYLTSDVVPARVAGQIATIIADRAKNRIENGEDLQDEDEWKILIYNILGEENNLEAHHYKLLGFCLETTLTPVNFSIFVEDILIWRLLEKLLISENHGGKRR